MSVVAALLDKARERGPYRTDSAIATHFGIHRQAVSKWRNSDAFPEEDHIVALAELAGESPEQWLVAIRAVRGHGPAAKVWQGLARKLAAATAVLVLVTMPALPSAAAMASQAASETSEGPPGLYIMRSKAFAPHADVGTGLFGPASAHQVYISGTDGCTPILTAWRVALLSGSYGRSAATFKTAAIV